MLAWYRQGYARRLGTEVVNYADDFVILCPPGPRRSGDEAMQHLMGKLGLTVNPKKARLVTLPDESFDFLGYTVGRLLAAVGDLTGESDRRGKPSTGYCGKYTTRQRRDGMLSM